MLCLHFGYTMTLENGPTKSHKWLIEWLREGVKDDEPHMVILQDMEENYHRANKVAHDGELSPDPLVRVWDGNEEEDQKLALLNKVKENFLWEIRVVQPRTKGKRELLNLESSINYGIASGPFSEKEGQDHCVVAPCVDFKGCLVILWGFLWVSLASWVFVFEGFWVGSSFF
jgi:hypothetical protein